MAGSDDIAGSDWSDNEQDLIVADYFSMLQTELAGDRVNKAERNRALQVLTGRSKGSIEFKHMNVSAALLELGLPIIPGYKPYANFQDSLLDAIDRYLTRRPELLMQPAAQPLRGVAEASVLFSEPPPVRRDREPPKRRRLEALIRKFDPVERDDRNRTLGKAGERLVVEFERRRLADAGKPELAEKVRWVADIEGDGHGYDILSFSAAGEKRLIEVKTTNGGQTTPFFLSRNEKRVSDERKDEFRLYRLYDFARTPRLFKLKPPAQRERGAGDGGLAGGVRVSEGIDQRASQRAKLAMKCRASLTFKSGTQSLSFSGRQSSRWPASSHCPQIGNRHT
ncbi:MAG: DUF3883 domain-containing protein [Caulobacter sp.]